MTQHQALKSPVDYGGHARPAIVLTSVQNLMLRLPSGWCSLLMPQKLIVLAELAVVLTLQLGVDVEGCGFLILERAD